jgi:hypothetical protein
VAQLYPRALGSLSVFSDLENSQSKCFRQSEIPISQAYKTREKLTIDDLQLVACTDRPPTWLSSNCTIYKEPPKRKSFVIRRAASNKAQPDLTSVGKGNHKLCWEETKTERTRRWGSQIKEMRWNRIQSSVNRNILDALGDKKYGSSSHCCLSGGWNVLQCCWCARVPGTVVLPEDSRMFTTSKVHTYHSKESPWPESVSELYRDRLLRNINSSYLTGNTIHLRCVARNSDH